MQSSRLIYPTENSVIIVFFDLCKRLLAAKQVANVEELLMDIAKYQPDTSVLGALSSDQHALWVCEERLFHVLQVIINYQLLNIIGANDYANIDPRIRQLRPPLGESETKYPLVHALTVYMRIILDILIMPAARVTLNASERQRAMMTGLRVIADINYFKDIFSETIFPAIDNLSVDFCRSLKFSADVMLNDMEPRNKIDECSATLVTVLLGKLFSVRAQMEASEKLYAVACSKIEARQTLALMLHQRSIDEIMQFDSIIRRINLVEHLEIRDRYNKQLIQYNKRNKRRGMIDVSFWAANVEVSNIFKNLRATASSFDLRLINIENIISAMMLLKHMGTPYPQPMNGAIMHQVNSIFLKSKLMLTYARSLMTAQVPEEDEGQFTNSDAKLKKFVSDLEWSGRYTYGLMETFESCLPGNKVYSSNMDEYREDLLTVKLVDVDFSIVKTEASGSMMATFFYQQIKHMLAKETNLTKRLSIIDDYLDAFTKCMARLNIEVAAANFIGEPSVCRRLILDVYFSLLMLIRNGEEAAKVLDPVMQSMMLILANKMPNSHEYQFINILLIKALNEKINVAAIDDTIFSKFAPDRIRYMMKCVRNEVKLPLDSTQSASPLVRLFLFKHIFGLLKHVINTGNAIIVEEAKKLTRKILLFYTGTACFIDETYRNLLPEALSIEPFRFIVDKSSFLPPELAVERKSTPENKRSDTRPVDLPQPEIMTNKVRTPSIDAEFSVVYDYFEKNIHKIRQFYMSKIEVREQRLRAYALLGLAHCLPYLADNKKRQALVKVLERHELSLTDEVRERYTTMTRQYKIVATITAPSLTPANTSAVTPGTTPSPSPTKTEEKSRRPRRQDQQSTLQIKRALFLLPPSPEKPPVVYKQVSKDPFTDMYRDIELEGEITFNSLQTNLIQRLHECKLLPILQGGGAMDPLLVMERRDTDLLCFPTSANHLYTLLHRYKKDLKIAKIKPNTSNVVVIKFCKEPGQPENLELKLELAFLPVNSPDDVDDTLRHCARNFGTSLVYFDPIKKMFIDPLGQARNIKAGKFDVAVPLAHTINACFQANRERMLDTAYKQARARKHQRKLELTSNMNDAIIDNRMAFADGSRRRISIFKFVKLFLLGHALESFDILNSKPFDCLTMLFPCLVDDTGIRKSFFQQACQVRDNELQGRLNPRIKNKHIDDECARFIACFLTPVIMSMHPEFNSERPGPFIQECGKLLFQTKFSFRKQTVTQIKAACLEYFRNLCQLTQEKNYLPYRIY